MARPDELNVVPFWLQALAGNTLPVKAGNVLP